MSKLVWKGGALLAPVPAALVSCGTMEKPNALTVAWTGIINSQPPKAYISVRPERYSHELISLSHEFVINLTTESLVRATDFCGVKSGRELDKLAAFGLTVEPSDSVSAPSIAQSPLSIECRVTDVIPLGSHDMFLADIVAVTVDEQLLDTNGRLRLDRAGLMAYVHGSYYALGKRLGDFGFSVRKKPAAKRKK